MDNWLEIMGLGGQRWATAGSLPYVLFDAVYLPRLYQTLPPLVVQKWRRQAVPLTVRHRCEATIRTSTCEYLKRAPSASSIMPALSKLPKQRLANVHPLLWPVASGQTDTLAPWKGGELAIEAPQPNPNLRRLGNLIMN